MLNCKPVIKSFMGAGGEKKPMQEIDATRAAGRDEAFEGILERVKEAGGEIVKDETSPLYIESGNQELEVGRQRIVEFNLNRFDFQLIRNIETHVLQGAGHQKHVEELESPRSHVKMKRKPDNSQDWQLVDLEDMF